MNRSQTTEEFVKMPTFIKNPFKKLQTGRVKSFGGIGTTPQHNSANESGNSKKSSDKVRTMKTMVNK